MSAREPDCAICQLLDAPPPDEEIILVTPYWRVALAPDQRYLGRAYVTAQRHVPDVADLSLEAWTDLHEVWAHYQQMARSALGATMFNWSCLLNDAYKDHNPRPHVHWHVRPRYSRPAVVKGQTWSDPNFGHHYLRHEPLLVNKATLHEIATLLREGR